MLRIFAFFIVCFLTSSLAAQSSFQRLLESGNVLLRNPKLNENGDLLYLQGVSVSASQRKAHLTQLDAKGDIRWSKSIGNDAFSSNVVDILPVNDGLVAPLSEIIPNGKNAYFLVKFDTLGKEIWNIRLADNTPIGAPLIAKDGQNRFWIAFDIEENNVTKTIFGRVSSDGKIQFLKSFYPQSSTLIDAIAWSEQSQKLVFSCRINDAGTPRNVVGAIDTTGELVWARNSTDFRFSNAVLLDNKVVLYSVKTSFQATDILSIHDISTGNILITKSLRDVECLSSNQSTLILQYGEYDLVVAYDADFSPRWAYKYPTCKVQTQVEMHINAQGNSVVWKTFGNNTLVTTLDKNGLLFSCGQVNGEPPLMSNIPNKTFVDISANYKVVDFPLPINSQGIFIKNIDNFSSQPFCPDLPNADFVISDSICMQNDVTPIVSTNASFSNIWIYDNDKIDRNQYPTLSLSQNGKNAITHILQNGTCVDTAHHFIQVREKPTISFRDTTICSVAAAIVDFTTKGATKYWLDGIELNPPLKRIEKAGTYKLKLSNGICESEKYFNINLSQVPDIQLNIDSIFCKNSRFIAKIEGFDKVFWDEKQTDTLHIFDSKRHRYKAFLNQCLVEGDLVIPRKDCETLVYLPNIFSPNDDGINDLFEALGADLQVLDFQIFNRWGALVFQADASNKAWNGKIQNIPAPDGVYAYKLTFLEENTNEIVRKSGEFLLVKSRE